ncbi:hypothetical protein [Paraburkholderia caribensis]|uniref:hypothetical protein n=1 Tax=Paraburkholderia caribensis TaxID=75105 RepID=UPI000720A454|nr:hypothetical protein [Paraburkholderia caribensis]ALP68595.1 hypothetical protein AN416_38430 [Paraburkholderia caribensis]AUT57953.1 hypothetical protein C2L66_39445 [Paraburkholderia caribensis]
MTETITVVIVAALAAYVGSVYASSRHGRMKAPETTAQAYRDMIAALLELRRAYLDISTFTLSGGNAPEETVRAMSRANTDAWKVQRSSAFLFSEKELALMENAIDALRRPADERVAEADKAIDALRQSASRLFRQS